MSSPQPFYFDTITFQTATNVWLDAALTTLAPDGFYAQSGIYREKSGGILGPVQACPDCSVPCNTEVNGFGGAGKYFLDYNVGNSTGAVVIKFSPLAIPDKLIWTYDGTSASEYSSANFGYVQGLIGEYNNPGTQCYVPGVGNPICNSNGSNGGTYTGNDYVFDFGTSTFISTGAVATMGPYTSQAAGGVDLVAVGTGYQPSNPAFMVVPKTDPNVSIVNMVIEAPLGGTNWYVTAYCPTRLNMFHNGPAGGACSTLNSSIYTCSVDPSGNGTSIIATGAPIDFLTVGDWVFSDPNGVNQLAAGVYPVQEPSGGLTKCITVSGDGVITNITNCSGSC